MGNTAAHIKAVILDLDGVIYRGHLALPGAQSATNWLRAEGYQTYYFTNNSTQTRESYVKLLAGFGISTNLKNIVTSASLTAQYFLDNNLSGATVMVVGEGGLADELKAAGVQVVRRLGKRPVDAVVVGMDRRFTYRKLYEAQQALRAGAEFIATNQDATYPVENGNVIPGGGSIVAAIAAAAEKDPILIGKPSPRAGELILHHAKVRAEEALIVGDRLETDIEMGRKTGLWTCLVLTGISSRKEAETAPEERRPHFIIEGIDRLPELLRELQQTPPPSPSPLAGRGLKVS